MGRASLLDKNVPNTNSEIVISIFNLSDGIVSFTTKDSLASFISPGFNGPISTLPFFIKTSLVFELFKVTTFFSTEPSPMFFTNTRRSISSPVCIKPSPLFLEEFFMVSKI